MSVIHFIIISRSGWLLWGWMKSRVFGRVAQEQLSIQAVLGETRSCPYCSLQARVLPARPCHRASMPCSPPYSDLSVPGI
jgi:hypothetical protein